ncbi:SEN1 N terminal-domain-containing protein [Jimgerdemannia flammicorona]|uniref:SEN1 N terminal-domain-containing protein n=1 Tax=Jimgerdemannia flammicorona TaxID=994334 RepID=A0A433QKR3_9FUNG|nr:SEN1 N terminal-domain-containing protein [Jimgerdemannia flammicorona]
MLPDPNLENLRRLLEASRHANDDSQIKEDFLSSLVAYLISRPMHWWCIPELREFLFESMILFSTASNDHVTEFKESMNEQLGTCTSCLEQYYKAKKPLYTSYVNKFAVDSVARFFDTLDAWDAERTLANLREAQEIYSQTTPLSVGAGENPPIQQSSMLSPRTVCALYEVLLCPAFLKRPVIDSLFVEVLIGVQRGHGFLKLANELIEGVVILMIHSDNEIRKWARRAIESYLSKGKFITPSLFMDLQQPITLIVRILGTQRLGQKQLEDVRRDGYNITDAAIEYWRAFKLLLRSMSPDTISEKFLSTEWKESAQDMSRIVCGIVWDHLEDEGPFFMGALISLNYLLEKAKGLFWVRAGVGTADQAYGAIKRVAGNQIFEQRMIQIIGMPDRGGTDGGGGAGSDKFTAEKLKPMFDWFNGVFISFETETIESEVTKHLLGLLLGYFQQPKWSEHCHVGCLDIAIKIINQCYTSDAAMIPFESMNEYGERIVRMAITASSPYSEKVRENTEDLVKFVLEDDGVTLRRSYVEFFSTNDGPLSRGAQLEICHRLWKTVCEVPLEELGTELAGAMLKAYGAVAFVDMIPDDLVRGVEEAKTKLMHHINSSLMIIRQHIISLVTQLCDCSANFFRTLMRIEGVPQVIWKLYCTPDAEVRSATVMFLREAFNEITKVDMIRHFFGDFPSAALEGVTSALTDLVELTNEGCDTLSVVKELFGSLSMLVDRDSDALLPYMATLQHDGDVRLPPELLKEFWVSFWTALTSGMNAGVGWSDHHKNSVVIPPILCMLEMAQAMVASYSTFEQLIQNDDAGRDGIWSSQQSYPKLDYQPVKAALDPLSEWMYVTKTKVLQCLVPLICAMLKRVAQARMSLDAEVYDKLMNVATATTKSKLTPVDREDLFIALSMHEPTQPVFVADSDEELDVGASSRERALTTTAQWDETERPTSSKSLPMRQTTLVEIYKSPRKVSSYLKDHVEDSTKSAAPSSVAGTGAVANLQKSLEGVRVGDRENAIVVEDDEDEFGDIEVLEIDDDWFEAVTRPKSSDQSYSTAQLKQNTSQTYPAIPGQSNDKYPQKDLSYVSNTIHAAPPPGTNRVLPFGKASIASKSRAPTTKAKFTSSKTSKMNALRLEFRHERKAMVGNVNRAANSQTIVDRSKVIPSAPMRPRVNQAEKVPESSTDSDSDDNATSGLLELTKQHTAPSIRLLQSKLRLREERRTTRLIEAPSLVRNSLEARNKQMEKEAIRRMRVSPNLEALHKVILSWDITVYGDMPLHASRSMYRRVPDRFDDTQEYTDVFQPLLLLEIWQQLMRAREEASESDIIEKCMIESRCNIDDFVDVDMRMDFAYAKGLATEDLVFFANHFGPEFFRTSSSKDTEQKWRGKGFLGKVSSINFKRDLAHIVVRCCFATDQIYVLNSVAPKTLWRALKLSSLTTAHREYSALKAMEYYDLRDDILKPQPVALPVISDTAKHLCMTKYNVNEPQAEAILGAVQRKNGFTLIQGPPGTGMLLILAGKTKTILGLVGALLSQKSPKVIESPGQKSADTASEFDRPSKLLVCAPSNAAVDEIVKRLKNGIMGERDVIVPKIVRVGTGDAINTSVKDVFLDTLVDKELANSRLAKENLDITTGGNIREQTLEEIRKIKLNLDDLDKQLAKAINDPAATSLLNDCRRASLAKKRQLTVQLDEERDQYQARARDFELAKRKARERILREADVMCCTLSGSGHEMLGNIGVSFETVIIDEAAQSIEISSLIPLKYDCKRCVLVGGKYNILNGSRMFTF